MHHIEFKAEKLSLKLQLGSLQRVQKRVWLTSLLLTPYKVTKNVHKIIAILAWWSHGYEQFGWSQTVISAIEISTLFTDDL